ncbi:hypothetical protein H8959_011666 [Pygathrix nigripes]
MFSGFILQGLMYIHFKPFNDCTKSRRAARVGRGRRERMICLRSQILHKKQHNRHGGSQAAGKLTAKPGLSGNPQTVGSRVTGRFGLATAGCKVKNYLPEEDGNSEPARPPSRQKPENSSESSPTLLQTDVCAERKGPASAPPGGRKDRRAPAAGAGWGR